MRYLKLFESFKSIDENKIHELCKQYDITNYKINPNGSIDVINSVDMKDMKLKKIPIKFNKADSFIDLRDNELTSLNNSPRKVRNFWVCNNKLTSFRGAPRLIEDSFACDDNDINSFKYFPSSVGDFYCSYNPIYEIWKLFKDTTKIELLNDFDIFRDEKTKYPSILIDGLNDFLILIGEPTVQEIKGYKNI